MGRYIVDVEVKHKIEDCLMYNDKLTLCQKLAIGDEHGLIALQGHCLALLDKPRKVKAIAGEDEFGGLSDKLKVAALSKML
ncbi:hypothetical protein PRIPAC_94696 [Pristionchus pacificus]|uniref:Uncharacterized protein n=1 Tax=Pristionchus pacificus TaxID=54126 RepID=A0A2A6BQT1_PRIPA|nr:hypothetical protein PRIPAC_94696 [Pristionchus pacificus]|eukprot:PDM68143.1 hypothetical protein PRIPAC_46187 [Pristionchus pacificus]